ncbi:MAG: hypothetical protein ACRD6X_10540 [Pyrinomonadaceae bacterium]
MPIRLALPRDTRVDMDVCNDCQPVTTTDFPKLAVAGSVKDDDPGVERMWVNIVVILKADDLATPLCLPTK